MNHQPETRPPEQGLVSAGLDFYKPTMSQLQHEKLAGVDVTFTLKNRGEQRLEDYVPADVLQDRLDCIREKGWQPEEIDFFASLTTTDGERMFDDNFLTFLQSEPLPAVVVEHDDTLNDIAVHTTGEAALVTFWETVIMSEINEIYFENFVAAHDIDVAALYDEGARRLDEKIAILRANPDIKFSDFGTRRHFSLRWQKYVVERLAAECPENFVGTSNVALSHSIGMKPIGTFAHEMPMIYAGIADARGEDIRASHNQFLEDWHATYGPDLSIALTDTFGTDFFFEDFTAEQAAEWRGVRHDSGDPIAFGERVLEFYQTNNIDPLTKTIVFSDGLDIHDILALHDHFKGRVQVMFGWGTTLTNDLGLKPLNIVAKATHVRTPEGLEADTVKLSDVAGKHTGPEEKVKEYQHVFRKIGTAALAA